MLYIILSISYRKLIQFWFVTVTRCEFQFQSHWQNFDISFNSRRLHLTLFIIPIVCTQLSSAVFFDCVFSTDSWTSIKSVYKCAAVVTIAGNASVLFDVRGYHDPEKNNIDVDALEVRSQDLKRIPSRITNFFPNIRALLFYSTGLNSLTADDLKPYQNLQYLNAYQCNVMSLNSDVFKYTPRLLLLDFRYNSLYHVGFNTLGSLNYLTSAYFASNPCVDENAYIHDRQSWTLTTDCQLFVNRCPRHRHRKPQRTQWLRTVPHRRVPVTTPV